MDFTKELKTNISLCTGSRGLERGIERTGTTLRTLAHVEIEAFICENLVQQMEQGVLDEAPIWSNLKTFDARPFCGMVDILTGGYPCQPFSVAGQRKGKLDQRHLWPYIGGFRANSIVGTVRPLCCFFENVPGHIELGYREVKQDLESLGYTVKEGIFSASEVGSPHQRKRLFILAVENSFCSRIRNQHRQIGGGIGFEDVRQDNRSKCPIWIDSTSKLADTNNDKECARSSNIEEIFRERLWPESSIVSGMGNTNNSGLQGWNERVCKECPGEWTIGSNGPFDRWPARPGEEQFSWEEPRIESSLGYAINGYNFREDLLRMAGNSVVEQTAELAWITLWNKIMNA